MDERASLTLRNESLLAGLRSLYPSGDQLPLLHDSTLREASCFWLINILPSARKVFLLFE